MKLNPVRVQPIGFTENGLGQTIMTFPATVFGSRLRKLRISAGISLREGARILGIQDVELGGLERSYILTAPEWSFVFKQILGSE